MPANRDVIQDRFSLPGGLDDPGWRYIPGSGDRQGRAVRVSGDNDLRRILAAAKKGGRLAEEAGLLDSLDDSITYGSGLSFSPDQIAAFQQSGLTPQAAAGPGNLAPSGLSKALPGIAGAFQAGTALEGGLDTDQDVANTISGGLKIGSMAAPPLMIPALAMDVAGLLGAYDAGQDDIAPEVEPVIGFKPGGLRQQLSRPGERYMGERITGFLDDQAVRAIADELDLPTERHTWTTQSGGTNSRQGGSPRIIEHDRLRIRPEDIEQVSDSEMLRALQSAYSSGAMERPAGTWTGGGEGAYHSEQYPFLSVYLDDFNKPEFGRQAVDALEQYVGYLEDQGVPVWERFAGNVYSPELDPDEDVLNQIVQDISQQFDLPGYQRTTNYARLPSGLQGGGLLDSLNQNLPSGLR